MENDSAVDPSGLNNGHLLSTWVRVYVHGLIALVVLCAIAYVGTLLVPLFDVFGSRPLAVLLSALTVVLGPPIVGALILFGVFPLLGKKKSLRGLLGWDDRLLSELSNARSKTQIVILNWPSSDVRTLGVLSSEYTDAASGRRMGAVYVPTAPQTRLGYIRIVDLATVEFTDWTFQQWQLYQLSFGSVSPSALRKGEPFEP
ncbi:MAG: hypothetical protein ACR2NZ_07365 [Rubripirellula sp.]